MPKFVSSSSGHIYAADKLKKEEDEILASIDKHNDSNDSDIKKPSAINKKGTKERQKSSLDLFKEELRRLNEEQEEQRNKLKNSLNSNTNLTQPESSSNRSSRIQVPVPLKPDPRCPTTLTLQVNLNPKDKDTQSSGSFDTGDPETTNLYIGNLNPKVTENDLCDIFGRFGSLASIKIMWPRTDEERARKRNSGFVAYMCRLDGERALKILNGMDYKGYDMKLGWGKAVPLPKNPVFVPNELIEYLKPPPKSGMPFNAQLHSSDIDRGYTVPKPFPKRPESSSSLQEETNPEFVEALEKYQNFIQVFERSTVQVCVPQDRSMLDKIHKTIEHVIREGPVFESIIIARENHNPDYSFLYDYESPEHVYYRWKLYSLLHGEDPYAWSTAEFHMYKGGPKWRPPPLNPFADGMPMEILEKLTGISRDLWTGNSLPANPYKLLNLKCGLSVQNGDGEVEHDGKLNPAKSKIFEHILKNLEPTKTKVGSAMLFCINHSYAAEELITRIKESICYPETTYKSHIAHVFLISDILNNSSAAVTNASYYREGFRQKLLDVFERLREYLNSLDDIHRASRFKQKILSVLGAWKYYQLYEDDFVLKLGNLLLGKQYEPMGQSDANVLAAGLSPKSELDDQQLDGQPVDDAILAQCLESKGLSLRWYKTLELSEDEEEANDQESTHDGNSANHSLTSPKESSIAINKEASQSGISKEKFKVSKWELVTDETEQHSPLLSCVTLSTPASAATTDKSNVDRVEDKWPNTK